MVLLQDSQDVWRAKIARTTFLGRGVDVDAIVKSWFRSDYMPKYVSSLVKCEDDEVVRFRSKLRLRSFTGGMIVSHPIPTRAGAEREGAHKINRVSCAPSHSLACSLTRSGYLL